MAFVSGGWDLAVTLVDRGLNQVTKTYEFNPATVTDDAEAATAMAAVIAALDGVTEAKIKGYRISQAFYDDAFTTPTVGEVENLAVLTMRIAGDPFKKVTHSIPAPEPSIFQAASGVGWNEVDTAAALVTAYRDLFTAGNELVISDGENISAIESGRRAHRKSYKG